jgi:hypothetical protein
MLSEGVQCTKSFSNEEISKSESLDMVCAMKSFENVDKDNVQEWMHVKWASNI